MIKRISLFLLTVLIVGGCASNQSVSDNQSVLQLLATLEGLDSITKQIHTTRDQSNLIKTIKKEAWRYVETTSTKSVEDAHAKAMKIINNPNFYSKKQLAVWEDLTVQPNWKWCSWTLDGKEYNLIMYILETDLK